MITKKGSHVGIVLSFVIFVTFIMFFYIMIQPALTTESKRAVLDILKENIIEMASAELTSVSVVAEEVPENCIKLDNFFQTDIGEKIVAKSNTGETLELKRHSSPNHLQVINGDNLFFRIYESEEFDQIYQENLGCGEPDYNFGLIKTTNETFETKILDIIERHGNDYQDLKKNLSVPAGNDFGLDFIYSNGTEISTKDSSAKVSILAEEFPVKYVTEDATIEMGILRIKIW